MIDVEQVRAIAGQEQSCPILGESVAVSRSFLRQAATEIEAGRVAQAKLKEHGL